MHGRVATRNTTLATRMVHDSLREFDPKKELVEDFHERFQVLSLSKIRKKMSVPWNTRAVAKTGMNMQF